MIVKLKCVDNAGYDYLTKGNVYSGKPCENKGCCYVMDNDGLQCIVSTVSDFHGVWEVVN